MKNKKLFILNLQLFAEDQPNLNEKSEDQPNPNPLDDLTPEQLIEINKRYTKKSDYDELKEKNSQLIGIILDGKELPDDLGAGQTESPSIAELRQKLYHSEKPLRNLEVVKGTLDLREAIMKEGKPDPFLPHGHDAKGNAVVVTQADIDAANRVGESLAAAVKEADGDPDVFDSIFPRMIR